MREIRGYSEEVGGGEDGDGRDHDSGSTGKGGDLTLFSFVGSGSSAIVILKVGGSKLFLSVLTGFVLSLVSNRVSSLDGGQGVLIADSHGVGFGSLASTLVFNDGGGGSNNDKGTSEGFHDVY